MATRPAKCCKACDYNLRLYSYLDMTGFEIEKLSNHSGLDLH